MEFYLKYNKTESRKPIQLIDQLNKKIVNIDEISIKLKAMIN
nr:hypothetical protein [Borreliella sinica]WPM06348.1 hypothetical protein QIA41_04460 [Borreliella sinica]